MAKTKISSTDLIWIFREKLSSFDDCSPSISIAIVPSSEGWTAVTTHRDRAGQPNCVRRIEQLQKASRNLCLGEGLRTPLRSLRVLGRRCPMIRLTQERVRPDGER